MSTPNKLFSIDEVNAIAANPYTGSCPEEVIPQQLAAQLANTMRENEELKKYPLKMVCEKCNMLTDITQHKHSETSLREVAKMSKQEWDEFVREGFSSKVYSDPTKTPLTKGE